MRRLSLAALVAALAVPAAASARSTQSVAANAPERPAAEHVIADVAGSRPVAHGTLNGKVMSVNGSTFTIQTPGTWTGVIDRLTGAASAVTRKDYPYVYGGGHAQAGVASIGIPGPGYNGHRIGFDCSGAVAAVLAAGGLWQPGSGVPNDAYEISQLASEGLIAPGAGKGPFEVTLYDDPGYHIFMSIDGGFFGTSDGAGGAGRNGGAGWLYDGAPDAYTSRYKRYHFLPSVLAGTAHNGHKVTFQIGNQLSATTTVTAGAAVHVVYVETATGEIFATSVTATTRTGT